MELGTTFTKESRNDYGIYKLLDLGTWIAEWYEHRSHRYALGMNLGDVNTLFLIEASY